MRNPLIYRYKLLFVIVLVLLLLVPFLNKAFHIDDTVVLYSARQIIETSLLGFSGATINWLGRPQSLRALSDSPLISQYTALIIRLLGENEFCLHTFFLIFPIIATISMYFLSKRFTSYPLISTLLLISTPSFIVSATNIMPDFALLAFYLAAVCTFVYGIDKEDKLLLIVSGFLVTLASLTKYTGLTVIPLLFFYAILKRRLSKGLLALSISFALLGIWYLRDFILFNKIQIVEGLWQFSPTLFSTISNLFSSLTYIGSVTVFPLLFLFLLQKKRDWFIYLLIIWLSTILLIPWLLKLKYTTFEIILSIFSISISIFILQKFIEFLKRKSISNYPDIIFLLTWLIGIFCHSIFILTWLTAPRYILMLIPPLILLLMKRYEILLFQRK